MHAMLESEVQVCATHELSPTNTESEASTLPKFAPTISTRVPPIMFPEDGIIIRRTGASKLSNTTATLPSGAKYGPRRATLRAPPGAATPLEQTSEESDIQSADEHRVSPNDAEAETFGKTPKFLPSSVTLIPGIGGELDGNTAVATAVSKEKEARALVSDDATERMTVATVPGAAGRVRQTTAEEESQPRVRAAVSPNRPCTEVSQGPKLVPINVTAPPPLGGPLLRP